MSAPIPNLSTLDGVGLANWLWRTAIPGIAEAVRPLRPELAGDIDQLLARLQAQPSFTEATALTAHDATWLTEFPQPYTEQLLVPKHIIDALLPGWDHSHCLLDRSYPTHLPSICSLLYCGTSLLEDLLYHGAIGLERQLSGVTSGPVTVSNPPLEDGPDDEPFDYDAHDRDEARKAEAAAAIAAWGIKLANRLTTPTTAPVPN